MSDPVRTERKNATPATNTSDEANAEQSPNVRELAVKRIENSFHWLNAHAQIELGALKDELSESDEPSWIEELLEGVVEVALTAGGAGVGRFVVEKLLAKPAREGISAEFVKLMFEEGVPKGVAGAKAALRQPRRDTVSGFVASHGHAITAMHAENQQQFDSKEPGLALHELIALKEVCTEGNMQDAARAHYEAVRDAWVTYVAYSKYKSMATQGMRDRMNRGVPGWTPAVAPSFESAVIHHDVNGVLEVAAHLPEIKNNEMQGAPRVAAAFLNGINESVRDAYEGRPLSEANVPRQIKCVVDGDMPNFTVNIDESGREIGALRGRDADWLRARASVATNGMEKAPDGTSEDHGLELLLKELIPARIQK